MGCPSIFFSVVLVLGDIFLNPGRHEQVKRAGPGLGQVDTKSTLNFGMNSITMKTTVLGFILLKTNLIAIKNNIITNI